MSLKVKVLNYDGVPFQATDDSVGYDLRSIEDRRIEPGEIVKIHTGISIQPSKGYYAQIFSRSSFAAKGLSVEGGVIDPGYTGEIQVVMYNHSKITFTLTKGERIAQMVLLSYICPEIKYVDKLKDTKRGSRGFGSSDGVQDISMD